MLSSLSPQASVTGAVFFSTAMQDLISLQLTPPPPVGYVRHRHWKVGEYTANWGTGELSMRSSRTFLQGKGSSVMKLWNRSLTGLKEKQWAGVNVWYEHLGWTRWPVCVGGRAQTHIRDFKETGSQLCRFNSWRWSGNHFLMPKCSIPLCSGLNARLWNWGGRQRRD